MMKVHGKTAWAKAIRSDRIRKMKVALDSYRRRGERMVSAKDVALTIDVRHDAVMAIGRSSIDELQIEGVVVTYIGGFFTLARPELRRLD